jgi:hypothetical protein
MSTIYKRGREPRVGDPWFRDSRKSMKCTDGTIAYSFRQDGRAEKRAGGQDEGEKYRLQ